MKVYVSKEELKTAIATAYAKYIVEFSDIPEMLKDKRNSEVDRTPAENLAYQVGWTTLLLKWEKDDKLGLEVKTPSDKFKWNQLGALYQWFNQEYSHLSLKELMDMLEKNIAAIYEMIDSMSEDELFIPHQRKWADEATKKQRFGKFINLFMSILLHHLAPLEQKLENGRSWSYNKKYI